jgi:PST family polysaccharide transporter
MNNMKNMKDSKEGNNVPLGNLIYSGTRWTAFNKISSQIIRFVVSIVLARLLAPQDFGLMAMALVVTGFIEIFKDMGTVAAIVQRIDVDDYLLSSLFYLNLIFGVFCSGAIVFLSGPLAKFYGDPRLVNILLVLSLNFFITSASLVKKALLQRNMMFDKVAIVELVSIVVQGAGAIVLAYFGWGVWALVAGAVSSSLVSTLLFWLSISWTPKIYCKWKDIQSVLYFSLNLSGAQTLAYFMTNIDKLIIGKYLGASPLGYYDLARRLLSLPGATMSDVLGRVLFPSFSKIQNDNKQLREKYLRACGAIAIITFPLLCGVWVLAKPFILVVYGLKWEPVVPLIQILTPVAIMMSLAVSLGPMIYLTKGRTDLLFKWHIVVGVVSTLGYIAGLRWGMIGVAAGYLVSQILLTYPIFSIPFRLIGLKFTDMLKEIKPYALITFSMAVVVLLLKILLVDLLTMKTTLIICVAAGSIMYILITIKYKPKAYDDFQNTFMLNKLFKA